MQHIFMDNYRGFSETLIPIQSATFLVGENSTGKSSFMALVYLLSNRDFYYNPDFARREFCNLGGFQDIVSATSSDRSYFAVGSLETNIGGNKGTDGRDCAFTILKFADQDGVPRLSTYASYFNETLTTAVLDGASVYHTRTQFRIEESPGGQLQAMKHVYHRLPTQTEQMDRIDVSGANIPLFLLLPIAAARAKGSEFDTAGLFEKASLFPFAGATGGLTYFAPIRTRPSRVYEGFVTDFTPEGLHTPFLIRRTLEGAERSGSFFKYIRRFGEESGLFADVKVHSFGGTASSPFEIQIELQRTPLNISNVGYGVSQVLPLIVEMITRPKGHTFAIQQPEVHLHPRAQAALGDLVHFLVRNEGHRFLIETHSDYLIDRFRLRVSETGEPDDSQVMFFERSMSGNQAHGIPIDKHGQYSADQPDGFRRFFINEELSLLEI